MLTITNKQNRDHRDMVGLSIGLLLVSIMAIPFVTDNAPFTTQVEVVTTLSTTQTETNIARIKAVSSPAGSVTVTPAEDVAATINNGKPTLFLFTPIDDGQARIVWETAELAQELQAQVQDEMNVITVPVQSMFIIDNAGSYIAPKIYWDVELEEPYVNWLPDFTLTDAGWGLDATTAVMVSAVGQVMYRGDVAAVVDLIDEQGQQFAVIQ